MIRIAKNLAAILMLMLFGFSAANACEIGFGLFEKGDNLSLYAGAANKEGLIEIDDLLQIDWDQKFLIDD